MDDAVTGVLDEADAHWRRNLIVCTAGSFTTIVAMTLLLPFLPLYVRQLGVSDRAAIAEWSGVAYGATFLSAACVAPLWGRLADRYGSKLMLIRASLGMTIAMALIGVAQNVGQLVLIRLFAGLAGGFASGSTIMVAATAPRARAASALGVLASGTMAGSLVGPLIGGVLPPLIGMRATFFAAAMPIFVTFLASCTLLRGPARAAAGGRRGTTPGSLSRIPDRRPVLTMLATGALLMLANMSVEPIITLYVAQIGTPPAEITFVAGLAMAAAALGSILSAPLLGRLADRVGALEIAASGLAAASVLLIPQAFVTAPWQLVALRFLMGLALGGILPCLTAVIRAAVPAAIAGGVLGAATSSQYVGQVVGPVLGGIVGGHAGMRAVFLATSLPVAIGAAATWHLRRTWKAR